MDLQSFDNLLAWTRRVRSCFEDEHAVYYAVVANKIDLAERRAISPSNHNALVREQQTYRFSTQYRKGGLTVSLCSYQVSAKTGTNVKAMFSRIAADLLGLRLSNAYLMSLGATLLSPRYSTRSKCEEETTGYEHEGSHHQSRSSFVSDTSTIRINSVTTTGTSLLGTNEEHEERKELASDKPETEMEKSGSIEGQRSDATDRSGNISEMTSFAIDEKSTRSEETSMGNCCCCCTIV